MATSSYLFDHVDKHVSVWAWVSVAQIFLKSLRMGVAVIIATAVVVMGSAEARAQFITEQQLSAGWDDVRKQQPPELQLKLTLPKTRFYRGEVIRGKLTFINTSDKIPYHMWTGTYNRGGRICDIIYRAQDSTGKEVVDPLEGQMTDHGGMGNFTDLGEWSIELPVNEWRRFDQPGVYTIYATSSRVTTGKNEPGNSGRKQIALVSDKVQITIDPLPKEEETKILDAAKAVIAAPVKTDTGAALDDLRFLDTPASRQVLIDLLKSDDATIPRGSYEAGLGLRGTADPKAAAAELLAAVADKRLTMANVEHVYVLLSISASELPPRPSYTAPLEERVKWQKTYAAAAAKASKELNEIALKASGGEGAAFIEILISDYERNREDPAARRELGRFQLKLNKTQVERLLRSSNLSDDFLPLMRREAAAANPLALHALMRSQPAEVRALLLEDAKLEKSRFFAAPLGESEMGRLKTHTGRTSAPELDKALHQKLVSGGASSTGSYPAGTFFYLECFGSDKLLPEVIERYRASTTSETSRAVPEFMRFWMRYDLQGALKEMDAALQIRTPENSYHQASLHDVLDVAWNDGAIPLLTKALANKDPLVVISAVELLCKHVTETATVATLAEPCIAALERVYHPQFKTGRNSRDEQQNQGYSDLTSVINVASDMLKSNRWRDSMSETQKQRVTRMSRAE
ncbi:MAG: hypothetical protein ACAI35_02170 [Candidatus Methylacidiphilales bacterium]